MTFAKYKTSHFLTLTFISLLLLLISQGVFASGYTAKNCLDQDFQTNTQGKGNFFGLLKHDLKITKSDCVIEAFEKKYLYLETKWKVDICREPIHLKREQFKSTSVYKKMRKCSNDPKSEFCQQTNDLMSLFKDVGLIFAEGNRQSLDSDHGKTYCAYLLIKEYLENDSVFVSGQESVFIEGLESSYSAPKNIKPMVKNVIHNIHEKINNAAKVIEETREGILEGVEASGSF